MNNIDNLDYDFEIEESVVNVLNKNMLKALIELLFQKDLIDKNEHTQLLKEVQLASLKTF